MLRLILTSLFVVAVTMPADAQWRGHHRGGDRGGYDRGYDRGQHRGQRVDHWSRHRDVYPHSNPGGNFIGGVIGGVIGGMIGNQPQPYSDPVTYCISRFRSYNPETGFYFGFDGRYHRCP